VHTRFFDELRKILQTEEGYPLPELFHFTESEKAIAKKLAILDLMIPESSKI